MKKGKEKAIQTIPAIPREERLALCTMPNGQIDLARYLGIDDSNFAIPFGYVDELITDEWDNGGKVVAVTTPHVSTPEEIEARRDDICSFIRQITLHAIADGRLTL